MTRNALNLVNKSRKLGLGFLASAAGLVALGAVPATAQAREHVDIGIGIAHVDRGRFDDRATRVWVPAVYRTVCDRVWVPARTHVEVQRVWHEPVVEDRCERVWVPDRFEVRDIVSRDRYGRRVVRQERILVERGHYTEVHRQVVVRPGCWENVERQVVDCEGHWDNVERQELVCAGHWEERVVRIPERHAERVDFGLNLGFRR